MSSSILRQLPSRSRRPDDCDAKTGRLLGKLKRVWPCKRRGMTMIMFALVFVLLISFLGLVIDGGFLLASHRRTQNAADAAALAAAFDLLRGRSDTATRTAEEFVRDNGLDPSGDDVIVTVNIPPSTGPYANHPNYVEVIVSHEVATFLMHAVVLSRENAVVARAVAGYEATSAGEGVMVLDPFARPGLNVTGSGAIRVVGRVVVNSRGEGVDEFGEPVDTNGDGKSNDGIAASAGKDGPEYGIFAERIDVVGGVDKPANFKHISQAVGFEDIPPIDRSPLYCRQSEEPDPLILLPIPYQGNGVDPTDRGDPSVLNNNVNGLIAPNFVATGNEGPVGDGYHPEPGEVILHPGVYRRIRINSGRVYMVPGIYVISPQQNLTDALAITGGDVIGEGIMFYNTSRSYNPKDGTPDSNDGPDKTPLPNDEYNGGFTINAGMVFTPINTQEINYTSMYDGAKAVSPDYDGMLFFQRRRNARELSIQGNAEDGQLQGTLYAKWARFKIAGQGTYDAQFICGSIDVAGTGNVTILGAGDNWGKANAVFLVE